MPFWSGLALLFPDWKYGEVLLRQICNFLSSFLSCLSVASLISKHQELIWDADTPQSGYLDNYNVHPGTPFDLFDYTRMLIGIRTTSGAGVSSIFTMESSPGAPLVIADFNLQEGGKAGILSSTQLHMLVFEGTGMGMQMGMYWH